MIKNFITYQSVYYDEGKKKAAHHSQQQDIKDLQLKTQLLLAEFDKGNVLNERLKSAEQARKPSSDDTGLLEVYKRTLELFVEHLNDFRE